MTGGTEHRQRLFQLDAVCDRFEREWADPERPPDLVEFLEQADAKYRAELLKLLLPLDVEFRRRHGMPVDRDVYLERFPELAPFFHDALASIDTVDEAAGNGPAERAGEGLPETKLEESDVRDGGGGGPSSEPNARPSRIGRYLVLQQLGRGGQGLVYRAAHPNLPIEVAIKVGRGSVTAAQRRAMREEAEVLCTLDHPHIARVLDLDTDQRGHPFLVLELVRGESLAQVLRTATCSRDACLRWLVEAARAVGHAHRRGVLHLDLKPANLIVTEHGHAKVIDFGMARFRHLWSDPSEEPDRISGTPQYMAPEQAHGLSTEITRQADLFALGAILYHVLTGRPPFAAASSQDALRRAREYHLDDGLLERADAPAELIEICRRAIACDPARRFPSAEAFAEALERDRVDSPARGRRRTKLAGIAAAALAVAILAASAAWRDGAEDPPRPASVGAMAGGGPMSALAAGEAEARLEAGPASPSQRQGLIETFELTQLYLTGDEALQAEAPLLTRRHALENDGVVITARFTHPVYCFLIAFNPDGTDQLCYPDGRQTIQDEPTDALQFPSGDAYFALSDGVGQQAFVLVASENPLPSYAEWWNRFEPFRWPDPSIIGAWRYRDGKLTGIGPAAEAGPQRGDVRSRQRPLLQQLGDRINRQRGTEAEALLFEVHPR